MLPELTILFFKNSVKSDVIRLYSRAWRNCCNFPSICSKEGNCWTVRFAPFIPWTLKLGEIHLLALFLSCFVRAGWTVLRSSTERLNRIIGSKVTENRAMERMDYRGRERGWTGWQETLTNSIWQFCSIQYLSLDIDQCYAQHGDANSALDFFSQVILHGDFCFYHFTIFLFSVFYIIHFF